MRLECQYLPVSGPIHFRGDGFVRMDSSMEESIFDDGDSDGFSPETAVSE